MKLTIQIILALFILSGCPFFGYKYEDGTKGVWPISIWEYFKIKKSKPYSKIKLTY